MNKLVRFHQVLWVLGGMLVLLGAFWLGRHTAPQKTEREFYAVPAATQAYTGSDVEPTKLYAHNLLLRKGLHFRVYVRWIRGLMLRTVKQQNPSFDNPESFVLEIQKGVINVKLNDIADFLNSGGPGVSPLKNITISNEEGELRLHGSVKKVVSLPVRLDGTLTPLPDGRLKYHLRKINVLKIPMKGLFGIFHVDLKDLAGKVNVPGIEIADNDIYFDTQRLLPPPHIHGHISSVTLAGDELKVVYGGVAVDDQKLAQWHNFLRLVGGSVDFGKLTMRDADLTMVDATEGPWFDLDLTNYQAQLVYGNTRMTAKAGVEVYMPNVDKLPKKASAQGVTLEWLRNRNTSPPLDVSAK